MRVNGVPTGIFGLNNKTSAVGDSINLGSVQAGDQITFVMHNILGLLQGGFLFSDPALNGPYDGGSGIVAYLFYALYCYVPDHPLHPSLGFTSGLKICRVAGIWIDNDLNFVFTNVGVEVSDFQDR